MPETETIEAPPDLTNLDGQAVEIIAPSATPAADELDEESRKILENIGHVAYSDIRAFLDDAGNIKPVSDWPDGAALAVSSIEAEEIFDGHGKGRQLIGILRKIKLWDKPKALEMLGRHKSLFHDRLDVNIVFDLAGRLEAMRLRRASQSQATE